MNMKSIIILFSCRVTKSMSSYALGASNKMSTRPLKFPNLITGYQRNPVHASQAALYTRYTPHEWFQKQVRYYNEADSQRHYSERTRNDALRIIRYNFFRIIFKYIVYKTDVKSNFKYFSEMPRRRYSMVNTIPAEDLARE